MASIEETAGRLELMGVQSCVDLERSIATPGHDNEVAEATARLVFVGDGSAQLRLAGAERSPDSMGVKWVEVAKGFITKGIKEHRLTDSLARSGLLRPTLREIQILEWLETREEVFAQNPGYHGSRYGPGYARAIASGRITFAPVSPKYNLRDLAAL